MGIELMQKGEIDASSIKCGGPGAEPPEKNSISRGKNKVYRKFFKDFMGK